MRWNIMICRKDDLIPMDEKDVSIARKALEDARIAHNGLQLRWNADAALRDLEALNLRTVSFYVY